MEEEDSPEAEEEAEEHVVDVRHVQISRRQAFFWQGVGSTFLKEGDRMMKRLFSHPSSYILYIGAHPFSLAR